MDLALLAPTLIDAWTIGHFVVGVTLRLRGLSPPVILTVASAWEILEVSFAAQVGFGDPNRWNSVADVVATAIAAYVVPSGRGAPAATS